MVEMMTQNSAITKIDLRGNMISDVGASALLAALAHCTTVTAIDLTHNRISAELLAAIAEALKRNALAK